MAALYLHVPHRLVDTSAFATAVRREMEGYARPPFTDAPVRTLYVGGGRPSRLRPSTLRTLIDSCRQILGTTAIEEATLELHPSDASPALLKALHRLGITRLNIEGRSFVGAELRATEGTYSVERLEQTIRQTRVIGFESVSVDLMFGGPDQSLPTWKASLQRAVDLSLPHVTLHEQDPGDAFQRDDAEQTDRFAFAMTFLKAKGYEPYELTHFARPGHRSRYQEHVYAHSNYLGLGPGAESFWWPDRTDPSTAERWSNVTDEETYVTRLRNGEPPVAHRQTLDRTALAREYVLLRLRTSAGLDLNLLANQYDFPLRARQASTLDRLAAESLIHDDPGRVRLTDRGRLLADAITQRLLS